VQKQAQVAATDSLFVEEKDDQGFENVEEKVRGKQDMFNKSKDQRQWNLKQQQLKQKQSKET
jgi:hypothetical protein